MITSFVVFPNSKIYIISFSLFLWSISLIIAYSNYKIREREEGVVLENPLGKVNISKQALEDFIKKVGQDDPNVRTVNPKIVISKKGVVVKVGALVSSNRYIPELISNLQTGIKGYLEGIVGIPNILEVVVKVSQISKVREERRRVE